MFDIIAQFDILGLGTLIGAILFLAALIWVIVDDRSFENLEDRHAREVRPNRRDSAPTEQDRQVHPHRPEDGAPARPKHPKKAA